MITVASIIPSRKFRPLSTLRPVIWIVDDHAIVRKTLIDWLESEVTYLKTEGFASAEALFAALETRVPDLVIIDISLPGMNGIQALRTIKQSHPTTPVMIITIHENPQYARDAFAAGAAHFLRKDRAYSELIPAIRRILESFETPARP